MPPFAVPHCTPYLPTPRPPPCFPDLPVQYSGVSRQGGGGRGGETLRQNLVLSSALQTATASNHKLCEIRPPVIPLPPSKCRG